MQYLSEETIFTQLLLLLCSLFRSF